MWVTMKDVFQTENIMNLCKITNTKFHTLVKARIANTFSKYERHEIR